MNLYFCLLLLFLHKVLLCLLLIHRVLLLIMCLKKVHPVWLLKLPSVRRVELQRTRSPVSTRQQPMSSLFGLAVCSPSQTTSSMVPSYGFVEYGADTTHGSISVVAVPELTCYSQAVQHPEWREAMDLKLNALLQNNMWRLVSFTPSMNVVGCKWIFWTKKSTDGSVEH